MRVFLFVALLLTGIPACSQEVGNGRPNPEAMALSARGHEESGELETATREFEQALGIAKTLGLQEVVSQCYKGIGRLHTRQGRHFEALTAFEQARVASGKPGEDVPPAVTLEQYQWLADLGNTAEADQNAGDPLFKAHPEWLNAAFVRSAAEGDVWNVVPRGVSTSVNWGIFHVAERVGGDEPKALGLFHLARNYAEAAVPVSEPGETAIRLYTEARQLFEKLGMKHRVAECFLLSGNTTNSVGCSDEALKLYERAIPLFEETRDANRVAYTFCMMGNAHRDARHFADAERAYETARKRYEDLGDASMVAWMWKEAGVVQFSLGSYARAEEFFDNAVNSAIRAGNRGVQADAQARIGEVCFRLRRIPEARAAYQAVMEYGEKAGKPIAAAQGYLGIAEVYAWLGRTNEALTMADKAVASYEAGNFWQGTAGTYQLIADVFADSGRPGEAFILLEKAAGLYHEGRQKDREAYTWERIALVLTQVCNSVDALRFHDMALQAFSEIGWKEEAIRITINKAFLLTELNRLDEAEPLARSAISLSEELGNPYATAGAYACLAEVMDHRGRPQEAIVASQTALGWAGKAGEPEQVAEMQGYLAEFLLKAKRPGEAAALLEAACTRYRASREQARLAGSLFSMARAHRAARNAEKALETYRAALTEMENLRDQTRDPDLSTGFNAARPAAGIAVLSLQKGEPLGAFAAAQRGKGVSVRRSLLDSRPVVRYLSEEHTRLLRESRIAYEGAEQCLAANPGDHEAVIQRARAVAALSATESMLRAAYPRWWALSAPPATLEQVTTALGPKAAALEFLVDDDGQLVLLLARQRAGRPYLASKLVGVDAKKLLDWIVRFREELQAVDDADERVLSQLSRRLYDLLIAPIAGELTGLDTLVVCPDRYLHAVPFTALRDAKGRYLIERIAVTIAPSASAYEACRTIARRDDEAPSGPPLVVAVSKFGDRPKHVASLAPVRSRRGMAIVDLPEAGKEAVAVEKALGKDAVLLVDEAATPEAVADKAPRARLLHFATHAFLNDLNPLQSALLLSPGGQNPMGLLYARDIYDIRLAADLTVLSGCSTMEGKATGEGLVGLAWAFLVAGCPSTVATHWGIDDASARRWMAAFYRSYATERNGAAISFQRAAKALIATKGSAEDLSSSRHWAAWSLLGNDRPNPETPSRRSMSGE